MCAIVMVVMPRPSGQPIACSMATNSSSSESPVITSGITSGAVASPVSSGRPRKRPKRVSARPASVPSTVAPVAFIAAILNDSQAAPRICWLRNSSPYHFVENPPQTVTRRDSLKEKTIISTIGRYRNRNPAIIIAVTNREREPFTGGPRAAAPASAGRS